MWRAAYADFNQNIQAYKRLNRSIAALTKVRMRPWCTRMTGRAPVVMHRLETTGKKASHFWGKLNSLPPVPVPYRHPETARTRQQCRQTNSISFLWRRKSVEYSHTQSLWIDVNTLKQRPVNTPALSESIICAVQWGMWIMAVTKLTTVLSE